MPHACRRPSNAGIRRLALAIINAAKATADVRAVVEGAAPVSTDILESTLRGTDMAAPASDGQQADKQSGLRPSTRQAIQVSLAAALSSCRPIGVPDAVVLGCDRGVRHLRRHQFLGRPAPKAGSGCSDHAWRAMRHVGGHFVRRRSARLTRDHLLVPVLSFHFKDATYSLITFWITTTLALLYGLLGEFSLSVLMLRVEDTRLGPLSE